MSARIHDIHVLVESLLSVGGNEKLYSSLR